MREVLKSIGFNLKAFNRVLCYEGMGFKLPNSIVIEIQFLNLLQIIQMFYFSYFIPREFEYLKLLKYTELETC